MDSAAPASEALLTSLAILNVNWIENRQSYLDNFAPFVYEAFRRAKAETLTPAQVKVQVVEVFGLDLPVNVVDQLLERAVRDSLIERLPGQRSRVFRTVGDPSVGQSSIAKQQAQLGRQLGHLVESLRAFVKDRFELTWGTEESEEALLAHVETHSAPLLESAQQGSPYRNPSLEAAAESRDFVVSTFVVHVFENDEVCFTELEALVKGSMLASALYLGTPASVSRDFTNTTLYLDTPVCLKALGHEGDEAREAASQTLALAVNHGARLACFSHTLNEIDGVLLAVQNQLTTTRTLDARIQGVLKHFLMSGLRESDAILARESLEEDLADLGVEIENKPEIQRELAVDEGALEERLQSTVGYLSRNTLHNDLDSLTAVHRLRGGRCNSRLETCKAVLVTDNQNLVRASRQFFNAGQHRWPLAMVDHELAALVWIKQPAQAPDLPRRQIISDCYAALSPSDSYWEKVTSEIQSLKASDRLSADEIAILVGSHEAQRSIMEVTLADPKRVDERSIQKALGRAIETLSQPARAEAKTAKQRAAAAEDAETQARFDATLRQGEVSELAERLARLEDQQAKVDARQKARARTSLAASADCSYS